VPSPPAEVARVLPEYTLLYTLDESRPPEQADYQGLLDVTERYLDMFMEGVLGVSSDILYAGSGTEIIDTSFILNRPIGVGYSSTALFEERSPIIATEEELEALLSSAFQGGRMATYIESVQALPDSNVFSSTTDVEFVLDESALTARSKDGLSPDPSESTNSNAAGIAAAAAAGALILLVTGFVIYRRQEEETDEKGVEAAGHVTVAGDTFTGASSMDSQSQATTQRNPYKPNRWLQSFSEVDTDELSQRPAVHEECTDEADDETTEPGDELNENEALESGLNESLEECDP